MLNRRNFLTHGATLATGMTLLSPTLARAGTVLDLAQRRDQGLVDPRGLARSAELKALVQKAIDTAMGHGASYADAHVSLGFARNFKRRRYNGEECDYHISVRALNNGYWGFASAPWLSDADVVRVAMDAATHAAGFGATRPTRQMEFVPLSQIERNGDWIVPAEIDPYEVDVGEVIDFLLSIGRHYDVVLGAKYGRSEDDKILDAWAAIEILAGYLGRMDVVHASSEGSYTVQTFHIGSPTLVGDWDGTKKKPIVPVPTLGYVGLDTGLLPSLYSTRGWENFLNVPIEEIFDRWVEEIKWAKTLPMKPVEVGKYDLLIDWQTMGRILGETLGPATQLDLAIGDHANGVGTSYLGPDIESYLGSEVATPQVSIRADRSTPGGAATVKWDDEGAIPREIDLVKEGRLVTYQTGREGAGALRQLAGGAMRDAVSHGFMGIAGGQASDVPLQHLPNFTLMPDPNGPSFDEMLRSMKKGYVLAGAGVSSDFQCLNGTAGGNPGRIYEVENGKITAHILGGQMLFRSPEFWSNVVALGGSSGARWQNMWGRKGEPLQMSVTSISAPPALVKDATLVRSGSSSD